MPNFLIFALGHFCCVFVFIWLLQYVLPSSITSLYDSVAWSLLTLIIAVNALKATKRRFFDTRVNPQNKAVFITGCDTGFGHEFAKRLHSRGFHVFAGCLDSKSAGADILKQIASKRLQVVGLDVTKDDTIRDAVNFVKTNLNSSELWAVVNNAGILRGFDVSLTEMKHFFSCMDVNAFGAVRVTKAFLPLIRKSHGRIVNVASIAGRTCTPHVTPYAMSKYANVAFSECLRQEMRPWGVKVISVEPEAFVTNITNSEVNRKYFDDVMADVDPDTRSDYGQKYFESLQKVFHISGNVCSPKVYKVVDALEEAVAVENPSDVYCPCRNLLTSVGLFLLRNAPGGIFTLYFIAFERLNGFPMPKEADNKG